MRMNEELDLSSSSSTSHVQKLASSDVGKRVPTKGTTTKVSRPSSLDNIGLYRSNRAAPSSNGSNECGDTDGRRSSKSEIIVLRPGKHPSSPAFRIQVTVHRPLSWQLSSSSTCSSSLPHSSSNRRRHQSRRSKTVRRCGSSPNKSHNENGWEGNDCKCECESKSMLGPPAEGRRKSYTEFRGQDFDCFRIVNRKCDGQDEEEEGGRKGRSRRRRTERASNRIQMSANGPGSDAKGGCNRSSSSSSAGEERKNKEQRYKRLKKGRKEVQNQPELLCGSTSDENRIPCCERSLVFRRQFSLKVRPLTEGAEEVRKNSEEHLYCCNGRETQANGDNNNEALDPPTTVMTCLKQIDNTVRKESGMGASGSTHGPGRLKSRSQSSSALYCIKSNTNGQLGESSHSEYHRTLHSTADYNNIGAYSHYHHHHHHIQLHGGNNNPLSSSIPADLWDLPPTTKSFSPITRKHSGRPHLEHQQSAEYPPSSQSGVVESKNQKNKQRPFPFVDAFIHRASEKHGKKAGKGRGGSGREKFYAVSCPDVAQEANNSSFRSSFTGSQHRVNVNNPDYGYSSGRSTAVFEREENDGTGGGGGGSGVGSNNNFKARSNSSSCRGHPSSHLHHHHCHNPHHHHHHNHPAHYQQQQQQYQKYHPSAAYQDSSCQTLAYTETDYGGTSSRQTPITFPFITEADIFEIRLIRDHRGLGLSVTGGSDSQESYPGLIRIKKVFPMSPAFQSGRLRPWDIILKANGVPLTGLTNHEALEVLRTTPVETILTVCRPPAFIPGFHILEQANNSQSQPALTQLHSPSYEDPYQEEQHRRLLQHQEEQTQFQQQQSSAIAFNPSAKSKSLSSLKIPTSGQQQQSSSNYGEFEVTLEKINGSLGFTLRQEDTSILGHYVRALVKDPALSDGRIQPGDRILSVNGYDLSGVSHADAIAFLRQCPPKVTLRLYRDVSPTPISPLSPTESQRSKKTKPLRQEAIDMLNDLALRKKMSGSEPKSSLAGSAGRTGLRSLSKQLSSQDVLDSSSRASPTATPPPPHNGPATLPRRRHGLGPKVTPSPEVLSAALDRFAGRSGGTPKSAKSESPESVKSSSNNLLGGTSYPIEARSSGSGESTPAGTIMQSRNKTDRQAAANTPLASSQPKDSVSSESSLELDRPRRPSFRQYTLHLDRISSLEDDSFSSDLNHTDSIVSEPGLGQSPTRTSNFRHGQPAYQSAILPSRSGVVPAAGGGKKNKRSKDDSDKYSAGRDSPTTMSDIDAPSSSNKIHTLHASSKSSLLRDSQQLTRGGSGSECSGDEAGSSLGASTSKSTKASSSGGGGGGLLKWKGVVFSQENSAGEDEQKNKGGEDEEDLESSATSTLSLRDTPGSSSNLLDQRKLWSKQQEETSNDEEDVLDYDDDDDDDRTEPLDDPTSKGALPQRRSPDGREFRDCDMMEVTNSTTDCNGEQIFTVQLNRRWCSRLGFSLQGSNGHTFISAIYPDSVAAKDGRLRVGDEIIMVNNETIRDVETAQVIDMMRKTRGVMNITILRKPTAESDSAGPNNSSAERG